MKPWQMGYEMPLLKGVADVFKQELKPYVHGAFGLPKENTVALALSKDQLAYKKTETQISAACIFSISESKSSHVDFSETQVATILPGDLFIRSIAGNRDQKVQIINSLAERSKAKTVWLELHEENRETKNMALELGFNKVLTKIAASSDIKGLYLRGVTAGRLPAHLAPEDWPGLKQLVPQALTAGQHQAIMAEIKRYEQLSMPWAQHYSTYNKRQSWTSFALQGFDPEDPGFIIKPSEMSKGWKKENPARLQAKCQPTLAAQHFPTILDALNRLGIKQAQRIRLMKLSSAGGELTRHADITDPEAGTKIGQLARLHIPVQTAPGCLFKSWLPDGSEISMHLKERGLFYLDTRKPHAVQNNSPADRIHIVVDAFCNPRIQELLRG